MAYVRMSASTWFEYNPLREGQIVEVPDETAAAWKKSLLATDATEKEYEAEQTLAQSKARAALAAAEQKGAGSNAITREHVEPLEAEESSATRSARK